MYLYISFLFLLLVILLIFSENILIQEDFTFIDAKNSLVSNESFCSFSADRDFGKYVKVKRRSEYYSKDCPLAANRFKKCLTEGYEWRKPDECELVEISTFTRYFSNRTLILWGDSLTEQLAGSLLCMFLDSNTRREVRTNALNKLLRSRRYCFFVVNNIKICFVYASDPKRHLEYVKALQNEEALVVMNFGVHYNKEKSEKNEVALQRDMESIIPEISKFTSRVIWRETSAQHFFTEDGSFSSEIQKGSGKSFKCKPVKNQSRGWRNDITTPLMLNVTPYVLQMGLFTSSIPPSLHRGNNDCTHFCNPGVTDDWSRVLLNYIYTHDI